MKCYTVISILSDIAKPKPLSKQRAFYYFIFVAYKDQRRAQNHHTSFIFYIYEEFTLVKESKLKAILVKKSLVINDWILDIEGQY
jgi:hypothetical protein